MNCYSISLNKKRNIALLLFPIETFFNISLTTCLRISEVTSLRWLDLDSSASKILVRDRKNPNGSEGNHTEIPLLGESLSIILAQPRQSEFIFPVNPRSVTAGFQRACKKLGITDLRYPRFTTGSGHTPYRVRLYRRRSSYCNGTQRSKNPLAGLHANYT